MGSREDRVYVDHTSTSGEVERLFLIDPRLKIKSSTQGRNETRNKMNDITEIRNNNNKYQSPK